MRRPWWQVVLAPRRRGRALRGPARSDLPGPPATALLAGAGLAGVLVGSTLDAGAGTAVMAASALLPCAVLGGALARARTALAHEGWQRHRLAGELTVADNQLRRLADRVGRLADQGVDDAAELERTRHQLRRARVELAGSRAVLADAREEAAQARTAADAAARAAAAARDEARASVERAVAEGAAAEAEALVGGQAARRPAVRVEGRRSFAGVDLRVFDAFTEADMADEDAVLDAPVRRGRHVARPDLHLDLRGPVTTPGTGAGAAAGAFHHGPPRRRDVA